MSIKFSPGYPTDKDLLDQAAGVGLEFVPGSVQEVWFLNFCGRVYSHGFTDGSESLMRAFREKTQSVSERVTESV